jgi:hypothetical protein
LAKCGYTLGLHICRRKAVEGMSAQGYGYDWLCEEHWRACNPRIRMPGEKWETKDGYISVKTADRGTVAEHVLVMEQKIGRKLRKGESVHHTNGVRHDNHPDNLELWVGAVRYGQRAHELHCPHCGSPYIVIDGCD